MTEDYEDHAIHNEFKGDQRLRNMPFIMSSKVTEDYEDHAIHNEFKGDRRL